MLEHVAGIMALLLSAGTSRAEEGAYSNLDRLGNALLVVSPAPQTPIRDGGKDIGYEGARNYLEHTRELLTTEQHEAAALLAWAAAEAALREIARLHKVLLERDQSTFVMSTLFSLGLLDDKEYTILQEAFRHRNFLAHGYYPPSGQLGSTWALIDVTR